MPTEMDINRLVIRVERFGSRHLKLVLAVSSVGTVLKGMDICFYYAQKGRCKSRGGREAAGAESEIYD